MAFGLAASFPRSPKKLYQFWEDMGWAIARPPGAGGYYASAQQAIDANINSSPGVNRPVLFVGTWDMASMPDTDTITIPRTGTRTDCCVMGIGRGQTIFQADDAKVFTFDTAGVTGGQFGNFQVDYQGAAANTNYMIDFVTMADFIIRDILVLNAHNCFDFRYVQNSDIYNLRARNPVSATTTSESAMLRLAEYFDGSTWRRCITLNFYGLRLTAATTSSPGSAKSLKPRHCIDIAGGDGIAFNGGYISPAKSGVHFKPRQGLNVTGTMDFNSFYIDGVTYGTYGLWTEAPTDGNGGTIGHINYTSGVLGNYRTADDAESPTESVAIQIEKLDGTLFLGHGVRTSNCDCAANVTMQSGGLFKSLASLIAEDDGLKITGVSGSSAKVGGVIRTTASGDGVTRSGTFDEFIWDNALFQGNVNDLVGSPTITEEGGFATGDNGTVFGGGGSSITQDTATPGFMVGTTPATMSGSSNYCNRTYIGSKLVLIQASVNVTTWTSTGSLFVTGLVPSGAIATHVIGGRINRVTGVNTAAAPRIVSGETNIRLYTDAGVALTHADISAGAVRFEFSALVQLA